MSILSNIAVPIAKLVNIKKYREKDFLNPRRDTDFLNKKFFNKTLKTQEIFVDGFQVLTIFPNEKNVKKHIIFLHGGAYAMKAVKGHRVIVKKMVKKYNLKVTFIDYPLAPENDVQKAHKVLMTAYKKITLKYKNDEFYLFGDSSGGGMALAFLQQLRQKKFPYFPQKTVLMSPWTDVSMSNTKIKNFIQKDPLLPLNGLITTGKQFAGKLDTKNPLISPIYGKMENLGNIFLIYGTNEMLYPDCTKLKNLLKKAKKTSVKIKIGKNMCHDWILAPFKETNQTIDEICNFYKN